MLFSYTVLALIAGVSLWLGAMLGFLACALAVAARDK